MMDLLEINIYYYVVVFISILLLLFMYDVLYYMSKLLLYNVLYFMSKVAIFYGNDVLNVIFLFISTYCVDFPCA